MFKFFTNKNWYPWSLGGTVIILMATWFLVQIDVQINQWFRVIRGVNDPDGKKRGRTI